MLSHEQTGKTGIKLAIAPTVALLLMLAVPSQASAVSAQSLVLSASHSQSQFLVDKAHRRRGWGYRPWGSTAIGPGVITGTAIIPLSTATTIGHTLTGAGVRLAPPPSTPLLANPPQRSMSGCHGQAPTLRLAAENCGDPRSALVLQQVHTFGMVRPRISPAGARCQRLTVGCRKTSWPPKGTFG
jgi:hypothetical protein